MKGRGRFCFTPFADIPRLAIGGIEPAAAPPRPPVYLRRRIVVVAEVIQLSDRKRWDRRRHNVLVAVFRRGISKQIRKGRR